MPERLNLIGMRFGRLVVSRDEGNNKFGQSMWRCECDCGSYTVTSGINLRNEHSTSCGCARDEQRKTHGHTVSGKSAEYSSWASMVSRCTNYNDASFCKYGEVGIFVADEWLGRGGFVRFLEHIGPRPSWQHSIDRIDGRKGYEPGNVRWASPAEQSRNLRSNIWIEIDGQRMIARDAATLYGVNYKTLLHRLKKMSPEKALKTPVAGRFGR